jgi:hypothetical protein
MPHPIHNYIRIPPNAQSDIQEFMQSSRPHNSIISQLNNDTVSFHSLLTTNPHTWLNDEVINFFYRSLPRMMHARKRALILDAITSLIVSSSQDFSMNKILIHTSTGMSVVGQGESTGLIYLN